jgi:thioredoxin 1
MVKIETVKNKKLEESSKFLLNINCEEFYSRVLRSDKLVVVDFWAEWCSACQTIKPMLEKLAEKYKDKIVFYRLNADACPNIVSTYQITSLPTVIIYYQSNSVERLVGATKISDYERFIENAIIRLNN